MYTFAYIFLGYTDPYIYVFESVLVLLITWGVAGAPFKATIKGDHGFHNTHSHT